MNLFAEALTKLGGLDPSPGDSHSVGPGRCLLEASVRCQCPPPPHRPQPTGDSHLCLGLRTTGKAGASLLLGHPAVHTEADAVIGRAWRLSGLNAWGVLSHSSTHLFHSQCILGTFFFFLFGHAVWHVGSEFPDQGSNPCPLQWKHGVPTTGLPGKSVP